MTDRTYRVILPDSFGPLTRAAVGCADDVAGVEPEDAGAAGEVGVWPGASVAIEPPIVGIGCRSGVMTICGRTCCKPLTTTQSSGCKPDSITRKPSGCKAPVVTFRYCALLFLSST